MIETTRVHVEPPPDDVFAFLTDPANWAAMDPALIELTSNGALAVGQSGTMTRRLTGMRVTTAWEITELQAGSRLGMRITGKGYVLTETTSLAADGDGTDVTVEDLLLPTSFAGRGFVAMSGPFIRRDLRDRAARLATLVRVHASSQYSPGVLR
jgi:carbon monoxide dehydrogenase subunit G